MSVGSRNNAKGQCTDGSWCRHILGSKDLLCIWPDNCFNVFVCIDPLGQVAQCDCRVTGYPEFRFGNIFETVSLSALSRESPARRSLQARPGGLIRIVNSTAGFSG